MIRYQTTSDLAEILQLPGRFFEAVLAVPGRDGGVVAVASGQRTVRSLGQRALHRRSESGFYRFFSHFKVDLERLSGILLRQIVSAFGLTELLLVVDDTLCPKWGWKIYGTGVHFDHVKRPRPGYLWGHNWIVLAAVVRIFGVSVAVPFRVRLYRPEKTCPEGEFRTRLQIVAEELAKVRFLFPSMKIDLVADGAYNNKSLLAPLRKTLKIHLVSRLRLDAVLRKDAPKRRKRKRGRKGRYGKRLPNLKKMARSGRGPVCFLTCARPRDARQQAASQSEVTTRFLASLGMTRNIEAALTQTWRRRSDGKERRTGCGYRVTGIGRLGSGYRVRSPEVGDRPLVTWLSLPSAQTPLRRSRRPDAPR